jgi:hypothetical protein
VTPDWLGRYVGIPYTDYGYDFTACHCWGLCHLVLKEEAKILTSTYAEYSASDLLAAARLFRDESRLDIWRRVDLPKMFDIVLMRSMVEGERVQGHCGIMISASRVLHTWRATAACHMAIDHPLIRNKIISFHRHRDLQ